MAYGDGPVDEKLRSACGRQLAPDALPSDTAMVSEGERVKQMLDRYSQHQAALRHVTVLRLTSA